ncbi:MAG: D-glycero-beta-D-manno-heptose 1-phosphate adenylyltransferase [Ilyomonas sp.]
MKNTEFIQHKIYTLPQLLHKVASLRVTGTTIAFTNGCFDILHEGHIFSLSEAAKEADFLIVGVNSDTSVCKLKGPERPVNNEQSRSLILASLLIVDAVMIFGEDTPLELITSIKPDVLVKGGDYTIDRVVGSDVVLQNGGRVVITPFVQGFSTTGLIEKIRKLG